MEPHRQNPAGRAFEFLTYVHGAPSPQTLMSTVAAEYFGMEDVSVSPELVEALNGVLRQVSEIPLLVGNSGSPLPAEFYEGELATSEQAILFMIMNLNIPVLHSRERFNQGTLKVLAACSHVINDANLRDVTTTKEDVGDATVLLQQLFTTVTGDESLDAKIRVVLIEHITEMLRALSLYKVLGVDRFVHEFDSMITHIGRRIDVRDAVMTRSPLRTKLVELAAVVSAVASIAHGPIAIANDSRAYFELIAGTTAGAVLQAPAPSQAAEVT
jgi:hypothetical protein